MAENRAAKVGFAAEAQQKMDSKYDYFLAKDILQWVKELTADETINIDGRTDQFHETLKDGVILCRLANTFEAGVIPEKKINKSKMAFKCMENINLFLEAAVKFGVPRQETFQSVDLWEKQNLTAVLMCLQSLARKASKYGLRSLGPKEAEANVRQFSEDQLRAGDTVISLQYGSNKGATQSGINFGNTRHM